MMNDNNYNIDTNDNKLSEHMFFTLMKQQWTKNNKINTNTMMIYQKMQIGWESIS